jgi:guanylate cyclase 2F
MYMSSSSTTKYLFSLQVDEGIEAMLCCWLQQLQEFGGPEVDKPDLLKGSIGSLRSHPQVKSAGSTSSLARNFLMDPKARYNVSIFMNRAC